MRILVTGGAGFIGSNLVQALLTGGHEVAVIDNLSSGSPANIDPRTAFRKLDILDDATPGFIAEFAPDAVVHLAAQASVSVSVREPDFDRQVNAEGTRRIAAAARDAGAKRVISASSAAVYGEPAELPLLETSRTAPINPYGNSKLEAEGLLAAELADAGVDYASFRFSNVYGPRQDAEGEGGVVAIFLGRVRAGEAPGIFGDGSQTRDFIYVGDVVAAIMAALVSEGSLAAQGPAYNISTGHRSSVNELVGAVRQAAHYFGPVETLEIRQGDIVHSVLSPQLAEGAFGWKAGVDLDTGVALTWRWFSHQG
ncbi:MAG TPA: NAD-dependent epimerase/dehydratase family protein [Coriobacteriia bacterium]|nr:NAD-dependent epimerase/dehydratase family protein [Coriobacteriia bacterium]